MKKINFFKNPFLVIILLLLIFIIILLSYNYNLSNDRKMVLEKFQTLNDVTKIKSSPAYNVTDKFKLTDILSDDTSKINKDSIIFIQSKTPSEYKCDINVWILMPNKEGSDSILKLFSIKDTTIKEESQKERTGTCRNRWAPNDILKIYNLNGNNNLNDPIVPFEIIGNIENSEVINEISVDKKFIELLKKGTKIIIIKNETYYICEITDIKDNILTLNVNLQDIEFIKSNNDTDDSTDAYINNNFIILK